MECFCYEAWVTFLAWVIDGDYECQHITCTNFCKGYLGKGFIKNAIWALRV